MTTRRSLGARLGSLTILCALLGGGQGAAASPQQAEDDRVTWAVAPADADGPDGRSWVELDLDPGTTEQDRVAVTNLGEVEATFALTAADGYLTDAGRFTMLTSEQTSTEAGTWIDVAEAVTVAPGETEVVPFTVTVPEDAAPGDHAAGLAASIHTQAREDGSPMAVESRIGIRVLTRVSGEVAPAAGLEDLDVTYHPSLNPFSPGTIEAEVSVGNTGNTRLAAEGVLTAAGRQSRLRWPDGEAEPRELLPGDIRSATGHAEGVWPLVRVSVEVTVRGQPAGGAEGADAAPVTTREHVSVWAIPWSQLVLLALIVGAAVLLVRARRARRARLTAMLAEARAQGQEQGRREARSDPSAPDPRAPDPSVSDPPAEEPDPR